MQIILCLPFKIWFDVRSTSHKSNGRILSAVCVYCIYISNPLRMFKKKTKPKIASPPAVANVPDANPRELPFETWSNTLQSLYLQNNNIQFLPNYLGNFTSMARLDVSQ